MLEEFISARQSRMDKNWRLFNRALEQATFKRVLFAWLLTVIIFAAIFYFLSQVSQQNGLIAAKSTETISISNAIYFSVVTATSTGYGDFVPGGFSRFFAIVEVFLSLLTVAILASKIVSVRQDIILEEVYAISFNEKINQLKSALYLFRTYVEKFMEKKKPSAKEFKDLWVLFSTLNVTLSDVVTLLVPKQKDRQLAEMDPLRREVLMNSVSLALKSLLGMLKRLDAIKAKWRSTEALERLRGIVSSSGKLAAHHATSSPTLKMKLDEIESSAMEISRILED